MTLRLCLAALLVVTGTGCGLLGGSRDTPPPPATDDGPATSDAPSGPATVQLSGTADMNAGGNAARVYVYPLVSDATFLSTPVQVFWDDPAAALGDDLSGTTRDVTVRPGEPATLDDVAIGAAAFLGIAADLRRPEGGAWRVVVPASQVRGRTLVVQVTEGGLVVSTP